MDEFNIEKISNNIIDIFDKYGISKDNLLIISIIILLLFQKTDDWILLLLLIMLIQ